MDVFVLTLYSLPVLVSPIVHPSRSTAFNFFLSALPLIVALPSTFAARFVHSLEWEHIARHGIYALSFTVASAVCIRWDVAYESDYFVTVLGLCVIGMVSLWFFVGVHILEVRGANVRTHYGDVAILPLALFGVGIAMSKLPSEIFVLARSSLVATLVIVAWATIFLLAFCEFATHNTTRLRHTSFDRVVLAGLAIAYSQLVLIETSADDVYHFALAFAAGVFAQLLSDPKRDIHLRPSSLLRLAVVSIVAVCAAATRLTYGGSVGLGFGVLLLALALPVEIGAQLAGTRWWALIGLFGVSSMALLARLSDAPLRFEVVWMTSSLVFCGAFLAVALRVTISAPSVPYHHINELCRSASRRFNENRPRASKRKCDEWIETHRKTVLGKGASTVWWCDNRVFVWPETSGHESDSIRPYFLNQGAARDSVAIKVACEEDECVHAWYVLDFLNIAGLTHATRAWWCFGTRDADRRWCLIDGEAHLALRILQIRDGENVHSLQPQFAQYVHSATQ